MSNDIDVGQISEALNDKVDRDNRNVDNAMGADAVIEYQEPSSSNNYTWYRKYKSGWVEQGGIIKNSTVTITMPVAMANTNYTITTSNEYYSANAGTPVAVWFDKTTTTFALQGRWNGSATSMNLCWRVDGIAA